MVPRLAPNVQLIGQLQGSGYSDQQWLVQRNGRFLQVTALLYRIIEHVDGARSIDDIARAVSAACDRMISGDQVRYLLATILIPRGLVTTNSPDNVVQAGQSEPRSALLVNMRVRMISPRLVNSMADVLRILYAPPVLVGVLLAIVAAHAWLYVVHGVDGALRAALFEPGGLAVVLALMIASGLFHELGHAAALSYGGARSRGIGAGLYLVYPVFYTDVTEAYRLGRWARLRTDLGGFYFHLIFAIALIGISRWLDNDLPLFAVLVINLSIIRQCLPFVRMDGYWALADLTGLPDFFSLIGPFLRSLAPASSATGRSRALPRLKRWVKVVFIVYVAGVIPMLMVLLVLLVARLPQLVGATWEAVSFQTMILSNLSEVRDAPRALGALTQLVFLALPLLGVTYVLYTTSRKLARLIWRWSRPTLRRRAIGTAATLGILSGVGLVWAPQIDLAPASPLDGVGTFDTVDRTHVTVPVVYAESPPVGGRHAPIWQNCGFYAGEIASEQGVHSMEHGAVWITYRPDLPQPQVIMLRQVAQRQTYVLISQYPDLQTPVVASAWNRQLLLDSADDPRLAAFVRAYRLGGQAPERGGPCSGGAGRPT